MYIEIIEESESFELPIGDSVFELRRFGSDVHRLIEKKHTTKKKNPRTGLFMVEKDTYAINADLLDYMITGWENVKAPTTGADVPCEYDIKQQLPGVVKVQIIEACDADSITDDGQKKKSGKT
jgi:hypothetical protein